MIEISAPAFPRLSAARPGAARAWWLAVAAAVALTVLLMTMWTLKDWATLSVLWLPDTDDMARLAQVRDWLNGQAFNDLMQHRSGLPGGASMHWSRLGDVGIALPILLLKPLVGEHAAEVAAVILYPAILFLTYLLLIARVTRRLGGDKALIPATLLAALAFPTISLFVPGRIDHHGLQIVLSVLLLDAAVARPDFRHGAIAGLAAGLSLAIGLETAPEILAALVAIGVNWLLGGRDDDRFALGFAAALGATTLALLAFARPDIWSEQWCDGFTPASTRVTLILAAAWGLMGWAGACLRTWPARLAAAILLGGGTVLLAWHSAPVCVAGPYGPLDPFLQRVWMNNVNEARSLFGQDTPGNVLAYAGLTFAGALLVMSRLTAGRAWRTVAIFLVLGAVAVIAQTRISYIMAGIAAIPFAARLATVEGLGQRLLLWVLGAGITWNAAATRLDGILAKPAVAGRTMRMACVSPAGLAAVAAQPAGTVMAPLDLDSYLLAMSRHHVVASVYHRNNAGNLAMYRFFLSPPDRARAQARAEGVDYVALCPGELHDDGLGPYRRGSLAALLQSSAPPPAWLRPIPTGTPIQLYRVLR